MHRRVRVTLHLLWRRKGRPSLGPVFISTRGKPYADTRGRGETHWLARAHITACSKVAIRGFRVQDWRHRWASHLVMACVDLRTLMELGGWTSLRMVERYAQVSTQHMAEAIAKVERFTFAGAAHRPRRRGSAAGIRASERKTS
jgi:integrase